MIKFQRPSPEDPVSYLELKTSKEDIQNISLRTSGVWALVRNIHCHDCLTVNRKQAFGNLMIVKMKEWGKYNAAPHIVALKDLCVVVNNMLVYEIC